MNLTVRELECLNGIANGKMSDNLGHALGIHKKTVDKHLATARQKLNAQTTTHAVAIAMNKGLLTLEL